MRTKININAPEPPHPDEDGIINTTQTSIKNVLAHNENQEGFTESTQAEDGQSEYRLNFTKNELEEIFDGANFDPEKLVSLLEKQYPDTYKQGVGVWERYTLKQHTLMVMRQFEKYFGNNELPSGIDKNIFRLILALHDIGKPEAIAREGKHLQHKYTRKYIKLLFEHLGIDKKYAKLADILVSGDPIGKYLTNRTDASQTIKKIEEMAKEVNMPINDFFELLCIYYKVDAGSYTENAGGLRSLDNLFDFDEEGKSLNFAPHIQKRIDELSFNIQTDANANDAETPPSEEEIAISTSKEEREVLSQQIISKLSQLSPFQREGREQYADNILESLSNFCEEMIAEKGHDPEKIKEMLLKEYEKVKKTAKVTVNLHVQSLMKVLKERKLRHYSELPKKRRDVKLPNFQHSEYHERRKTKDEELGYGQRFIVGCLASKNGFDEIIGPAPFYGHAVIVINDEKIRECTQFFEGDSMTQSDVVEEIMPKWLMKKWDNTESRKLDFEAALFSKALFEVYLKLNNLTHIHNMYVEAHLLNDITAEDFEEIYYGAVDLADPLHRKDGERTPEEYEEYLNGLPETSREGLQGSDDYEREKLQETLRKVQVINRAPQVADLPDVEVRELKSRIRTREKKWRKGWTYTSLTSDRLF